MTTTMRSSDGRNLAVEESGDPQGSAVFLLHGMPGSRLGPRPRGILLYQLGIRLITYDRPGYGDSDRRPGRHVADVVPDVTAIADELGIQDGDVIVQINRTPIEGADEAAKALNYYGGRGPIRMFFERNGQVFSTDFSIQ